MSAANRHDGSAGGRDETNPPWLALVRQQVASLQFGTVLITIHDSRVVQVEKSEKLRIDPPSEPAQSGTVQSD